MHSPEIGAVLHEFKSHMRFAVASFPHGHDFGLDGFAAVLVHQLYFLPNNDRLFQEAQSAALAHSLRPGFDRKYIARRRFPTQRQSYGDRYANCAAALFKSKVQQGHIFTLDRRSGESCFSVNEAIFSETQQHHRVAQGGGGPINERQHYAQLPDLNFSTNFSPCFSTSLVTIANPYHPNISKQAATPGIFPNAFHLSDNCLRDQLGRVNSRFIHRHAPVQMWSRNTTGGAHFADYGAGFHRVPSRHIRSG
jgi:hypothetical protein